MPMWAGWRVASRERVGSGTWLGRAWWIKVRDDGSEVVVDLELEDRVRTFLEL